MSRSQSFSGKAQSSSGDATESKQRVSRKVNLCEGRDPSPESTRGQPFSAFLTAVGQNVGKTSSGDHLDESLAKAPSFRVHPHEAGRIVQWLSAWSALDVCSTLNGCIVLLLGFWTWKGDNAARREVASAAVPSGLRAWASALEVHATSWEVGVRDDTSHGSALRHWIEARRIRGLAELVGALGELALGSAQVAGRVSRGVELLAEAKGLSDFERLYGEEPVWRLKDAVGYLRRAGADAIRTWVYLEGSEAAPHTFLATSIIPEERAKLEEVGEAVPACPCGSCVTCACAAAPPVDEDGGVPIEIARHSERESGPLHPGSDLDEEERGEIAEMIRVAAVPALRCVQSIARLEPSAADPADPPLAPVLP